MNAPENNQQPQTTTPEPSKNEVVPRRFPLVVLVILILAGFGVGTWYLLRPSFLEVTKKQAQQPAITTVTIGIKSAPLGFYGQKDVEYESPTFNFNSNIFEGLTTFTKDFKFASRQLAASWDNPNDTTWRLRLRKGVKFHNGDDFTAADAKFSIDFGKKYVVRDDLARVKEVKIVDPYTILVETNGPAPLLLNNLINVYVLSKKHVEKNGFDNPVGTGPYKFSRKIGNEYKLVANENYYSGSPEIKTAIYKVIENDNERINALLNGKVDFMEDVPAARISDIQSNGGIKFKGVPSLRVIYLGMDVGSSKTKYSSASTNPFKKLKVRQAIYKAINEDEIISQVMGGHAYSASQLSISVNFGFNPNLQRMSYDPEGARELLKEAGFPNGFDIILDVPNNRYQNDEKIGRKIVEHLAKVGIRATLNAQPKEKYFPKVLDDKDTSFYLLGWSQENGDAGGAYGTLLHTPAPDAGYGNFNIGKYSNKTFDNLIERSDVVVNSVERLRILQEIAIFAMSDVPVIPLHQQEDSFAVSKKFNWTPRRDNGIRAFEISVR